MLLLRLVLRVLSNFVCYVKLSFKLLGLLHTEKVPANYSFLLLNVAVDQFLVLDSRAYLSKVMK